MKKAMTMLGPVPGDRLGHILPHEHVLMEFPDWGFKPLYPEVAQKPVTLDILGKLRRNIWSSWDNLRLDDPAVMMREVTDFKASGGGTIVDVTVVGLNRRVRDVAEISRATGVHIVAGTGYYIRAGHPPELADQSIIQVTDRLIGEVTQGIDDTGIRAGIIGEIGVSLPGDPQEEKVLRAAARAQRATGVPLTVHQYGGSEVKRIGAILAAEGVVPERIILSHMDSAGREQQEWAAQQGYYVEFDGFGNEYYTDPLAGTITRDPDRVRMVQNLIARGHLRQILVSNDVALKILLKRYGGWGYAHIIKHIKPFMLRQDIPPKAVDTILYYNPQRAICYLD